MREIKFRAKNKETGEWVYGSNLPESWGQPDYLRPLHVFWEWVERDILDPETVGQYIDRKDKKDKEMYEGDVVSGQRVSRGYYGDCSIGDCRGVIVWLGGIRNGYYLDVGSEGCCPPGDVRNLEVIGTVHDNPELLEGG